MNFFFLKNKEIFTNLLLNIDYSNELSRCAKLFLKYKKKNKIILIGNGGSASISTHVSVDLSKNAQIRAINLHEASLITCLSNDYGHQNWMQKALSMYCDDHDLVILISSSGESLNILNAAKWCVKNKIRLVTFTGFSKNNSLTKINKKSLNFWVDSKAYNHVELVHLFLLLNIVDFIIGRLEYKFT
jgi:D-sedoheptulose 7-phosphate isomerase